MSNKDLPIGVGIIVVQDGKILCGIRTDNGLVCGPGGHIEKGEKPEQAARREAKEEFGITPKKLISVGYIDSPDDGYNPTQVFLCQDYDGEVNTDDKEMTFPYFAGIEELQDSDLKLFPAFEDSLGMLLHKIGALTNDEKRERMKHDAGSEDLDWITVNGNRIPIDPDTGEVRGGNPKAFGEEKLSDINQQDVTAAFEVRKRVHDKFKKSLGYTVENGSVKASYGGKDYSVEWFEEDYSVECGGPSGAKDYISNYMKDNKGVLAESKKYMGVMENTMRFSSDHDCTVDAVTLEEKNYDDGYSLTFHQNKTETEHFGGYNAETYAMMTAIAMHELNAPAPDIGYFGGGPESSFNCKDRKKAMKFAIAHNQHSIFDCATFITEENPFYDYSLNPIEGKGEE